MKRLGIKPVGEADHLICFDRDRAEPVHVAFNMVLKVTIGDRSKNVIPASMV